MFKKIPSLALAQFSFLTAKGLIQRENLQPGYSGNIVDWIALSDDPSFSLKQTIWPGFYMLEFCIDFMGQKTSDQAKVYLDYGEGLCEDSAIVIPFLRGRTTKRIIYFTTSPREVRFDPVEFAGEFILRSFQLKPLLPSFAQDRMLKRIISSGGLSKVELMSVSQQRAVANEIPPIEAVYLAYQDAFSEPDHALLYQQWIMRIETPCLASVKNKKLSNVAKQAITFSVIMPVYNPDPHLLECAIQSVLNQLYPHWELCIADDCSTDPRIARLLMDYASRDSRIRLIMRDGNGHISAASNSALSLASGEYVALLDHDDELAEHALLLMAQAIESQPAAKILYSDEDKIDQGGIRFSPHFKPDWNPDLFLSQNYLSHLGVYQHGLVKQIGGFRLGVEGAQDYDLCLRCLPHLTDTNNEIIHIPHVLYHWRVSDGSTAKDAVQKSYTTDAGIKALQYYLASTGQLGARTESGLLPNTYRVRYSLPVARPLVSLLIPTRDGLTILKNCIDSILDKTDYARYEIIIIDNQSEEPATLEYLSAVQADPRIAVLQYDGVFNFSAINNFGVEHAKGDIIGLVNNDVEVISSEWLTEMVSHCCRPEVGCVGAKLHYSDGRVQHGGVILGIGQVAGHAHKYFDRDAHGYFSRLKLTQNFSAVTAACLLVRRDIYEAVGGLNETELKVAFNDVDFCLRVREAGYRNLWTPYAQLYHHESVSRGTDEAPEKRKRFKREVEYMLRVWGDKLQSDPFYSPHLSLKTEDFSLGMRGFSVL